MTKNEFRIQIQSEIEGEIRSYKHIMNFCRMIIRDRKKTMTKRSIDKIVNMNKHLWNLK